MGAERVIDRSNSNPTTVNCVLFFSSCGMRNVASGLDDTTIRLCDMEKCTLDKVLVGYSDMVNIVAFLANGDLVASTSDDMGVIVWYREMGGRKFTLVHSEKVNVVAFLDDRIATASSDCKV